MASILSCLVVSLSFMESMVKARSQPNIVFIVADDLGWNDVGFHNSDILTPNIDSLVQDGVQLNNYFVQPICSPTRSQLLSGRYQIHTGLQHGIIEVGQPNAIPRSDKLLPEKLRDLGYRTHMIGKWHVGYYKKDLLPTSRGFDSFLGYLNGAEDYYTHKLSHKMETGMDFWNGTRPLTNASGEYSTEIFTKEAERIIQSHPKEKPLFLYLPFQAVHSPLQVPDKYLSKYMHIKNNNRRNYAGMVSCLDEAVKNVTESLKKSGLWNNTLFVFSTDNGGQVFEGGNNFPLRGWKASLWDGGLRGVGFVHGPMLPQRGIINNELMHVSDWFPTLVSLAGGSTSSLNLDGLNLWDTISRGSPSPRKELLHNIDPLVSHGKQKYPNHPELFDNRIRAALRYKHWKIITGKPGPGFWIPPPNDEYDMHLERAAATDVDDMTNLWLFDVENDPYEYINLADSRPDVVKKLLLRLSYWNSTAVPVRFPSFDPQSLPSKHGGFWGPWM